MPELTRRDAIKAAGGGALGAAILKVLGNSRRLSVLAQEGDPCTPYVPKDLTLEERRQIIEEARARGVEPLSQQRYRQICQQMSNRRRPDYVPDPPAPGKRKKMPAPEPPSVNIEIVNEEKLRAAGGDPDAFFEGIRRR